MGIWALVFLFLKIILMCTQTENHCATSTVALVKKGTFSLSKSWELDLDLCQERDPGQLWICCETSFSPSVKRQGAWGVGGGLH